MTFVPTLALAPAGLNLGAGTKYQVDPAGIDGLGVPAAKTADTVLDGRDGVYAGPDFMGPRVITIPVEILGDDQTDLDALIAALNAAFAPANDGVDVTLTIAGVPGCNGIYTGRAREVTLDLSLARSNVAKALLRFDALAPLPA